MKLSSNTLLLAFLDEWLVRIKPIIKPSTWETYQLIVKGKIEPYFSDCNKHIKDYVPYDFSEFFCYLAEKGNYKSQTGLSRKSVKNIRSVLSSSFEFALQNSILKMNPVISSSMPAFANRLDPDVPQYTAQQVHDLLGFAKESHSHIYVFLLLALFTGLRKGELMALTWADIDFNKNTLRVNKSRTGKKTSVSNEITTPKTKSSNRVVPLNDLTIEALRTEREKQLLQYNSSKPDDYIIKNIHGLPYSNLSAINRVVNRLTEKAGLPHCTIHGFRHSVATILDENGVPLQEISILLGHESIVTTEKLYIRRRRTAKKETIDILSSAIISDKNNL